MSTIVIMPGGFHPFHAGHAALYNSARRTFPDAEVFVAATNDTSTRPFPFAIKEKLAKLAGVEPGHFVQVKSPFQAKEITANFNPEKDKLIFVRSEKDANKPPQAGGVKKDGSPSYLQPLLGAKKLEPFGKHAYMAYLPTVEFGPGMTSATEIRAEWPTLDKQGKLDRVMSLYPATQKNPALAANVVKMLDTAMGSELDEELFEDIPGFSLKSINEILLIIPRITNRLSDTAGTALQDTAQMTELLPLVIDGTATPEQEAFVKEHAKGILKIAIGMWLSKSLGAVGAAVGGTHGPVIGRIAEFITKHVGENFLLKKIFDSLQTKTSKQWHDQNNAKIAAQREYDKAHPEQDPHALYKNTRKNPFNVGMGEGTLNEFAPDDTGDNRQEDLFFKYAKLWYNGNLQVQQRIEEVLAQAGWEIGEIESEEGGAFIVQSGDEDGDTYMGWSAQELEGLNELRIFHPADKPGRIDVYYRPAGTHSSERRVVAKNIPYRGLDLLTKAMVKKFGIGPADLEVIPVDQPHGEKVSEETRAYGGQGGAGMTATWQQKYNQPPMEGQGFAATLEENPDYIEEKWSQKYKDSINCSNPRGFSQRAHCAGRKK